MDTVKVIEIKKSVYESNDREADKLREELKDKGIKMGIVSNKVDSAVKELAARFFPEISVAIGESEGARSFIAW